MFNYSFYCTCFICQKYIDSWRAGLCSLSCIPNCLYHVHCIVMCNGGDDFNCLKMTLTLYIITDGSPEPGVGSLLRVSWTDTLCPALLCLLLTLIERNKLMKSKHSLMRPSKGWGWLQGWEGKQLQVNWKGCEIRRRKTISDKSQSLGSQEW